MAAAAGPGGSAAVGSTWLISPVRLSILEFAIACTAAASSPSTVLVDEAARRVRNSSKRAALRELALKTARAMSPMRGTRPIPRPQSWSAPERHE